METLLSIVFITGHHCNTANPGNFVFCFCRTVYLAAEDLDGQGTFGMEGNTEKEEIPLEIREGSSALRLVPDIKCASVKKKKISFQIYSLERFRV